MTAATERTLLQVVAMFRAIEREDALFREILFAASSVAAEREFWYEVFDLVLHRFIKEEPR